MTVEILRIHEDLIVRDNKNFNLNVREWLASLGRTTFSKPTEEMSKQKLNVHAGNP